MEWKTARPGEFRPMPRYDAVIFDMDGITSLRELPVILEIEV